MSEASYDVEDDYSELITLWILRALVHLRGYQKFVNRGGFSNGDIIYAIGLGHLEDEEISSTEALKLFKKRLRELEHRSDQHAEGVVVRNIRWLSDALGFTNVDEQILLFSVLWNVDNTLSDACGILGIFDAGCLIRALTVILDIPRSEVVRSLRTGGPLMASGLLKYEAKNRYPIQEKLSLLDGLQDILLLEHTDTSSILNTFFYPSSAPRLCKRDYSHIEEDYDLLCDYVRACVDTGTKGVNILIYGQPGTGKTELVRLLASESGLCLHEITMRMYTGEPMDGGERFSVYHLAQTLLGHREKSVILFDEIEDVFPDTIFMAFASTKQIGNRKAWVNRMLEENPVPAFWVSNEVNQIDPAFLRRFDYVLELRPPARSVRHHIMEKYLDSIPVSQGWIARMAGNEHLVPAHIERAAKIINHLKAIDSCKVEDIVERALGNTLEVLGHPRRFMQQAGQVTDYHIEYINADQDLVRLIDGIQQTQKGRICLYGPPGTGKTAYAHYLAEALDKPLQVRHASDILNKWVGGTEQNIARIFRDAEQEDAILLLDEADSLLQERRNACNGWEITQVNELLVQMEAFEGIFIASTNLMDNLDAASLRRFDIKIKFDYMNQEQTWRLFCQVLEDCDKLPGTGIEKQYQDRLAKLSNLTPGDFAAVIRKAHIMGGIDGAEPLLDFLEDECLIKPDVNNRQIGFTAVF